MSGSGTLTIRELVTRLGFEVDEKTLDAFDGKVEGVKKGLLALTGIATAAAVGLIAITKSAASSGAELRVNSDLTGLNIQQYQRYSHAASLAGVENDSFVSSLQILTRNIGEAVRGNKELRKSFGQLGVSPEQLKNKSSGQILEQLAGAFQKIPSASRRASLAMDIFGRSGIRMGRFLSQGSEEIAKANKVIDAFGEFTDETAEAGDAAGSSLQEVFTLIRGIRNEIGIKLFPVMKGIADSIVKWTLANKDLIKQKIDVIVKGIIKGLEFLWNATKKAYMGMVAFINILGGVHNAAKLLAIAIATIFTMKTFSTMNAAIAVIQKIGNAAMVAQVKALLFPIAIGAAIAGLIIILEDFYTYFQGGDSVILQDWFGPVDRFKKKVKEMLVEVKEAFKEFIKFIKEFFTLEWDKALHSVLATLDRIIDAFGKLDEILFGGQGRSKTAITPMFGGFGGSYPISENAGKPHEKSNLADAPISRGISAFLGAKGIGAGIDAFREAMAPAPKTGAAAAPFAIARDSGRAGPVYHYEISMPITVPAPAGTPPDQVDYLTRAMEKIAQDTVGREVQSIFNNNPRHE